MKPKTLPMAPKIVEAPSIEPAFAEFDAGESTDVREMKSPVLASAPAHRPIFCDLSAIPDDQHATRVSRFEQRRDLPESREKWRFGLRTEAVLRDAKAALS